MERFADIQLLTYKVPQFESLTLPQKTLVYYLTEAALCGRDILFDQNGRYNLRLRHVLEAIYLHSKVNRQSDDFLQLEIYLKRLWFSSGIHHHYGMEKFEPGFSPAFLEACLQALTPAQLPLLQTTTAAALYAELHPVIFDKAVMPKRVNQADGEDLLRTSACNYYLDVTQAEAEAYYARLKAEGGASGVSYGLNSRLVKRDGVVQEEVYKLGGRYTEAIERIVFWLRKAEEVAENEQQRGVIASLIRFYETGSLEAFDEYSIRWVSDTESHIDFVNGFIETYGDPLGLKASWESLVNFKDVEATKRTEIISRYAQWFEDHSPIRPEFKKESVTGVSAKVITAAILAGDLYPATAIGINLPNADWIRAAHGSKSVTLSNITDAYDEAAKGNGFLDAFAYGVENKERMNRYGALTGNLHTDLHECLGHGSGKLLEGVDPDSLKAYGATIEEARADLFALYYIADPKLVELGLLPNDEAYKAEYDGYVMNGLITQLVRIQLGHEVEESHMRNRQLIARWVLEQSATDRALELIVEEGKTYVVVNDYGKLRERFGELLAEVQRIKSTGDWEAARRLVEGYGVKIDAQLHREVLERYRLLNLAPYKGFINPVYTPIYDSAGVLTDVSIRYDETYTEQMLRYSRDYAFLPPAMN